MNLLLYFETLNCNTEKKPEKNNFPHISIQFWSNFNEISSIRYVFNINLQLA